MINTGSSDTTTMLKAETTSVSRPSHKLDFSIIVPTYNEVENARLLVEKIYDAIPGENFEIVFVDDDSSDGTRKELFTLADENPSIRMIQRIGRRGLSTAVIEGILSTTTPFVIVIDADLQHDESIIPQMLEHLRSGDYDIVIGSRYVAGGGVGDWSADRVRVSSIATRIAKLAISADVSDPMSGFFAVTREAFESAVRNLSGQGYKILIDICASAPQGLRIKEVPYVFKSRLHGDSKLDSLVIWEYLLLVLDKFIGHIVPVKFISFAAIGSLGVFIHMGILAATMNISNAPFWAAQTAAAVGAMIFNFFVNNILTYRDQRIRGFGPLMRGLLSFVAVCSVGMLANVGIADYLFSDFRYGWFSSGLAGILVGAVWNYATTSIITWRAR